MKSMVIFVDSNIVCDVLEKREPFFENSLNILKLCETKKVKGYFSSLSFANMCYHYRKEWSNKDIEYWLNVLSGFLIFIDLDVFKLKDACLYGFNDYEDAIQAVSADYACADYIVTRNVKDFKKSTVKAVNPNEFLKLYSSNIYPDININASKVKDIYEKYEEINKKPK